MKSYGIPAKITGVVKVLCEEFKCIDEDNIRE
jgi:hypothetical protein